MNARFGFLLAVISASLLAACGGGGGGGGGTPPTPVPTATHTPTPVPSPTYPPNQNGCVTTSALRTADALGTHPITNGNSYTYSGSLTQTIARSSPCPIPTSTSQATVSVTATEGTPGPTASPATQSEEHSVEVDNFATRTTSVTTDAQVMTPDSNKFYELAENSTDQGGNTVTTAFTSPGMQFALLPESNGNTWSNSVPHTVLSKLADGSTYSRTYSSSGIYAETDTLPGGVTSTITQNADGSGAYDIGSGPGTTFAVTLTAPSGGSVIMKYNSTNHTVPLWYSVPLVPYSDTTQDFGTQSIDAACGAITALHSPGSAEKIVRTTTTVDTILGYIDTRTTTSWDLPNFSGLSGTTTMGPICVEISDVEKIFYDYSLDTMYYVARTSDGKPIQTNTITEVYAMNSSAPVVNLIGRARSSAQAFDAQIVARQAGITFTRNVERADRVAAFARALHNASLGGRQ